MFRLFGKKKEKPRNMMDEVIHAMYGNPPPPRTAVLNDAIEFAYEDLLMGAVDKNEITQLAKKLFAGPIPYSTHDLAVSLAMNFFKQEERKQDLFAAQLMARMKALEWAQEGKVVATLLGVFEDTLYKAYKIDE